MMFLMNKLAEEAAKIVECLPEEKAEAVVEYARYLAEKADGEQWEQQFSNPKYAPKLRKLADDALAEARAGKTQPLDPDQM